MSRRVNAITAAVLTLTSAGELRAQRSGGPSYVQAQMRNVDFHLDASIIIHIEYLRGQLLPRAKGAVPYFDDKRSFTFGIDSARMSMSARNLSDLLNRYVFAYPGSPLSEISIAFEGGKIRQRARTRGFTVTTLSDVSVTPDGRIRLHPTTIKAAGIPVGGLMRLFGLRMGRFVDLSGAKGVAFDGNDMILTPEEFLPPPAIKGRLSSVSLSGDRLVQVFRPADGSAAPALTPTDSRAQNYMYYRGGVLRFGRLTMTGVDLLIQDADQRDAFDFFLDRYNRQLAAGYSRSTLSGALIAIMPDFSDVGRPKREANAPTRPVRAP